DGAQGQGAQSGAVGRGDQADSRGVGVGGMGARLDASDVVGAIAAAGDGNVFGDGAGLDRGGDDRGFVGAGDGDGDVLDVEAAIVVGNLDREDLGDGLVERQIVGVVVGDGVRPAHHSFPTRRSSDLDGAQGQGAQSGAVGRGDQADSRGVG